MPSALTYITLALLAGVLLKVVSARAGHSSTWFTADRYVYVDHAVNRKAAEQIAAVFDLGAHRSRNEQAGTAPDEGGRTGRRPCDRSVTKRGSGAEDPAADAA